MAHHLREPAQLAKVVHHREYYLRGGDITFLVENHLYRVHSYFFDRESTFFHHKLSTPSAPGEERPGTSDRNAFTLEGVRSIDFERFVWCFYNPKYSLYDKSVDEWSSILELADGWSFSEIKSLAIRELEKLEIEPIQKIYIYHRYNIGRTLLMASYSAVCTRPETLSLSEGHLLGLETSLRIAEARERIRAITSGKTGTRSPSFADFSPADVEVIVREVFEINGRTAPASPGPTPAKTPVKGHSRTHSGGSITGALMQQETQQPTYSYGGTPQSPNFSTKPGTNGTNGTNGFGQFFGSSSNVISLGSPTDGGEIARASEQSPKIGNTLQFPTNGSGEPLTSGNRRSGTEDRPRGASGTVRFEAPGRAEREREERERAEAARVEAERETLAREEEAARQSAARETAAREEAARQSTARETAARDEAIREAAARDQAAREASAREAEAAREASAREEEAAREASAREEEAAREASAKEAEAAHEAAEKEKEAEAAREAAKEAAEAAKEEAENDNWGLDELQTPVDTPAETPIETRSEAQAPTSNNPFLSFNNHTNEEAAKPEGDEKTEESAGKKEDETNEPAQKQGGGKEKTGTKKGKGDNKRHDSGVDVGEVLRVVVGEEEGVVVEASSGTDGGAKVVVDEAEKKEEEVVAGGGDEDAEKAGTGGAKSKAAKKKAAALKKAKKAKGKKQQEEEEAASQTPVEVEKVVVAEDKTSEHKTSVEAITPVVIEDTPIEPLPLANTEESPVKSVVPANIEETPVQPIAPAVIEEPPVETPAAEQSSETNMQLAPESNEAETPYVPRADEPVAENVVEADAVLANTLLDIEASTAEPAPTAAVEESSPSEAQLPPTQQLIDDLEAKPVDHNSVQNSLINFDDTSTPFGDSEPTSFAAPPQEPAVDHQEVDTKPEDPLTLANPFVDAQDAVAAAKADDELLPHTEHGVEVPQSVEQVHDQLLDVAPVESELVQGSSDQVAAPSTSDDPEPLTPVALADTTDQTLSQNISDAFGPGEPHTHLQINEGVFSSAEPQADASLHEQTPMEVEGATEETSIEPERFAMAKRLAPQLTGTSMASDQATVYEDAESAHGGETEAAAIEPVTEPVIAPIENSGLLDKMANLSISEGSKVVDPDAGLTPFELMRKRAAERKQQQQRR